MSLLEKNILFILLLKTMNEAKESILLIGAGPMAIEYAGVLKSLKKEFIVIGRSKASAEEFEKNTGVKVITGGLDKFLEQGGEIPSVAIVAVSEEQLGSTTIKLLEHGIKLILVEKPAGLDFDDIKKVYEISQKVKAKVYIGYNRRFYVSVKKAQEIIKKDGGILSILFDFTEASFRIAPLTKAPGVKENWFLQNSTHVIDLAFFLAGNPKDMCSFTQGSLPWHSKASIFSGAGITEKNVTFAYHANWDAPGRWSLEIMTKNNKLIFKPLEKLQIQNLGSFEVKDVELDDKVDTEFKAGIYAEVTSFLGDKKDLCTIVAQATNLKFYQQILEGKH